MKIKQTFTLASLLFIAVGCAQHHERAATYNNNDVVTTSPGSSRTAPIVDPSLPATDKVISPNAPAPEAVISSSSTSSSMSTSDQAIVTRIHQSLANDSQLVAIAPAIQVSANNGTVTLSGSVDTEGQRQAIETLVHTTPGVANIDNQLRTASQTSQSTFGAGASTDISSSASGAVGSSSMDSSASSNSVSSSALGSAGMASSQPDLSPTAQSSTESSLSLSTNSNSSSSSSGAADMSASGSESSAVGASGSSLSGSSSQDQTLSPTSDRPGASSRTYSSGTTNSVSASGLSSSGLDIPSSGSASSPSGSSSQSAQSGSMAGDTLDVRVQTTTAADASVGQRISEEVKRQSALAPIIPLVKIVVSDGKVTLQGVVRNAQQKKDLETSVKGVMGVSSVDNQLQVSADQAPVNR